MRIGLGEILLIVTVGIVLLGLFPLGLLMWVRGRRASAEDEVRALGTPRLMDGMANTAGVYSRGATQARGNGCLAAFDQELVFVQWVPRRTLRIPRSSITGIQRVNSFLGKTRAAPMLEVLWDGPDGSDSAAWWVTNIAAWERELATD